MKLLTIIIEADGAAFEHEDGSDNAEEMNRILAKCADIMRYQGANQTNILRDSNGNLCGAITYTVKE